MKLTGENEQLDLRDTTPMMILVNYGTARPVVLEKRADVSSFLND
jgi:hypothetical protein